MMHPWTETLGISNEAIELYLSSDVIDLHVDSFIWTRIFGYDIAKRHSRGLFGARFYSQVDLPRIREAHIGGAIWVITTNPLRRASRRPHVFARNLNRLRAILDADGVAIVRNDAEYRAARAAGRHAAFLGVQGGNALDLQAVEAHGDALIKVTLVHLSNSPLGATSAPGGGDGPLTAMGHALVERLNAARVFVDLAHINRRGFFDAVAAHDRSQPLLVSHTGVAGVRAHWRNLDDEQIRAVADTGGTIGVMYQSSFLGESWGRGQASWIVDHLAHIVAVAGEDFASLGSDWDGMITTPRDLATCLELPRLVQLMLDRGWSPERVRKIMGGNFLRAVRALRG
jgi:membrane dipeptidase